MNAKRPTTPADNTYQAATWEKVVAYSAAFVVLALVVFLVVRNEPFADPNLVVFVRIVLSLATAVLGATIPGFLHFGFNSGGILVRSLGAFALFALTYIFTPKVLDKIAHAPVFVQLAVRNAGGLLDGEFGLSYERDDIGPNTVPGINGKVTITDLGASESTLKVIAFNHPRLEIAAEKQADKWVFPIPENRIVTIPVQDTFIQPDEPTRDDIKARITEAGLSEADILKVSKSDKEKDGITLTIKNSAGRDFDVWIYDCWWCYNPDPRDGLSQSKYMDAIRCKDTDATKKQFSQFHKLKSTSGYFAVFIVYDKSGKWHRQFMGIHNLFAPENTEFVVSLSHSATEPFQLKPAP